MRDWFEAQSRWSKLRGLGQSYLVRASILIPAFGYILLLNENLQDLLTKIKFDDWLLHHLPPTWRIWLLFFGTSSLATASLLFSAFCPVEIKRYWSAFQMADLERHHRTAQHQTEQIAKDVKSLYANFSDWEDRSFKLPRLKPDQPNLGAGTSPELQTSDQWSLGLIHIWTGKDLKHPRFRIIVFVLLWFGLILIAIPAVITFISVISVFSLKVILFVKHLFA